MVKCKCQFYLMDSEGIRVCSVCGKPALVKSSIEDKNITAHQTKAPLFTSNKDKREFGAQYLSVYEAR